MQSYLSQSQLIIIYAFNGFKSKRLKINYHFMSAINDIHNI